MRTIIHLAEFPLKLISVNYYACFFDSVHLQSGHARYTFAGLSELLDLNS